MAAWATVDAWLARTDTKTARELTVAEDAIIQEPDRARIAIALDDATAELEGYRSRVPDVYWPSAETRALHAIKVATYLLSIGKSGKEYEVIRNGYTDTITFYVSLVEQAAAAAAAGAGAAASSAADRVAATAPEKVFTDASLKGLV